MKPLTFSFSRLFSRDLGIDLGTTHTLICTPAEGILLQEPSIIAIDHGSRRVLSGEHTVGNLAKIMHGRTPDSVQTVRPVQHGVVADFETCTAMLRAFFRKVLRGKWWSRPRALVAIPGGITPVERQALRTVVIQAGARQVFLINKSLVAALGVGLPVTEPVASMICDIGGGTTEIAVICLGDVAVSASLRVAANDLDVAITDHLRRTNKLCVGEQMAERIKCEIGAAVAIEPELTLEVGGRDVVTGLPRKLTLTSREVCEALQDPLRTIVNAVQRTLERCPAELAADLMENGMVLVGGGAQLRGLDRRLAELTGMPVRIAEEPQTCTARGLTICLEHLDVWHNLIEARQAA